MRDIESKIRVAYTRTHLRYIRSFYMPLTPIIIIIIILPLFMLRKLNSARRHSKWRTVVHVVVAAAIAVAVFAVFIVCL